MMISAKYPSKCASCGERFGVGTRISWSKGAGAKHVTCPGGKAAPRKAAPREEAGDTTGERKYSYARYGARDASAIVGCVYQLSERDGGEIVTVIGASVWYENDEDNEDMGDMQGGGWGATLWVRGATDAEATPLLAASRAKAERAAQVALAEDHVSALAEVASAEVARLTAGLVPTHAAGTTGARLVTGPDRQYPLTATAASWRGYAGVLVDSSSDYDDVRVQLWLPREAALIVAREAGYTAAKSREWLAQYRGCWGQELHEIVASGLV